MNITLFPHLLNNEGKEYIDASTALERIKTGQSKELTERIRKETDKEKRAELKRQLPCICFGGEFSKRAKSALETKSGLIVLDFDDVENLEQRKKELSSDPYTHACFVSPSGNGLKALVKVDPNGDHGKQFDALKEKYPDVDISGRDISRVCFESYDPEIYTNPQSVTWYEEKTPNIYVPQKKLIGVQEDETVQNLLKWWSQKFPATEGQRNTNLFKLACTLFDFGVSDIYGVVSNEANGLSEREIKTIIASADRKTKENGTQGTQRFEPKQTTITLEVQRPPVFGQIEPVKEELVIDKKFVSGNELVKVLAPLHTWKWNELRRVVEINGERFTDDLKIEMYDDLNEMLRRAGATRDLPRTIWEASYIKTAKKNSYHPILGFFDNQEWDGKARLQDFASNFTDKHGLAQTYILYFLLGSIEKAFNPSFQNPVLVLEGESNLGKSFTASVLGKPFLGTAKQEGYFYTSSGFDSSNKDHRIAQTQNFIWEWGESSGLSKQDVSALKEGLTASHYTDRRPYDSVPVTMPCLANFVMTRNRSDFITDPAMLRRLNVLYLQSINLEGIKKANNRNYMTQVWLEAHTLWLADTQKEWINSVDHKAKLELLDESFERPVFYDVLDKYLVDSEDDEDKVTTADLVRCIRDELGSWNDTRTNTIQLNNYMREKRNSERSRFRSEGKRDYGFKGFVIKENPRKHYFN